MSNPEPDEWTSASLVRALGAIYRIQTLWLTDLGQVSQEGDPGVVDQSPLPTLRRWEEQLTALKLYLHRAESRLLNFLTVPTADREWHEFPVGGPSAGSGEDASRRWQERLSAYFQRVDIDTTYHRLGSVIESETEALPADIVTDLAMLAEVAEATMPALDHIQGEPTAPYLEDLAFYHVLSPWKQRGGAALLDVLRWLSEILREREDL